MPSALVQRLLNPASVALIGVSRKTGAGSLNLLEVLIKFGYKGDIYPVNPLADEILGRPCFRTLEQLPVCPELAVISVRRDNVPVLVRECAEKGIPAAIIISDGFAEADRRGKELQTELTTIHRQTGIRLLGPNSMGVVNAHAPFTSSFVDLPSHQAPLAFIGQSGLFIQGFSRLKIGKGIDVGNGCDIGFAELVEGLLNDDEVKVIALHIEALKDPGALGRVFREFGHEKPVVVYKSGQTGQAEAAAMSHSGSLIGNYDVYKAFFRAMGMIVAENTEELEDLILLLTKIPVPEGRRVGIITPTGGGGIVCLDACDQHGFSIPALSEQTRDIISEVYPSYYTPGNPVDIMSAGFRHGYGRVYRHVLSAMLADKSVDIVFCVNGIPTLKTIGATIADLLPDYSKPVLSWVIGKYDQEQIEKLTENVPVAVFSTPERAFRALNLYHENTHGRA
jgi:acetyltransferase